MLMSKQSLFMMVAGICSVLALVTGVMGFIMITQDKIVAGLIFLLGLAQIFVFSGLFSFMKARTLAKEETADL